MNEGSISPIQAFINILPLLGMHLTQKNFLNHMLMMNKYNEGVEDDGHLSSKS